MRFILVSWTKTIYFQKCYLQNLLMFKVFLTILFYLGASIDNNIVMKIEWTIIHM